MTRKQAQPKPSRPLHFTRADPKALAAFDPDSKVCAMNCGPHRDDPRTQAERMLLCGDCWPAIPEKDRSEKQ